MKNDINTEIEKITDREILSHISNHPEGYDEMYIKYKYQQILEQIELTEEEQREIRILGLLEELGFPMEQSGTYLFKDMVMEGMELLRIADTKEEKNKIKQLMTSTYSQFYTDVARNDRDMGIKTFHQIVNQSYSQINRRKLYQNGIKKAGIDIGNPDYMDQAYRIANYCLLSEKSNEQEMKKNTVLVKVRG